MTTTTALLSSARPANQPLRVLHRLSVRYAGTKELHRATYRWIAQDGTAFSTKKAAISHNLDLLLAS